MPPLSAWEIVTGLMVGALARCAIIGVLGYASMSIFVPLPIDLFLSIFIFAVLGNVMLSSLGILAGLWAERFDHMATVTNFIITPLTFLSGTFYALSALPETWQKVALFNPFFYMIDGFRAGFIGHSETPIITGMAILLILDLALLTLSWWMLKTGYKTKS